MFLVQYPVNICIDLIFRSDEEEKPNNETDAVPGNIPNNKRRKKKDKDLRKNIRKIRDDLELEKATQVSANIIKRKSLRVSRAHFPLVNHEK
jgi:hypothetical protein